MTEPTITLSELKAAMDADCCLPASEPALHALVAKHEPKPESLFGRWATHPEHGRGIITAVARNVGNYFFVPENKKSNCSIIDEWVDESMITLDPATLTTLEDYQNAPLGTIVEELGTDDPAVFVKRDESYWPYTYSDNSLTDVDMADMTCRVVRWGDGR